MNKIICTGMIVRKNPVIPAAAKIGSYNLQISGQALSLDLTLVTHNTREFKRVTGLRFSDWEVEESPPLERNRNSSPLLNFYAKPPNASYA